MVKDKPSFKGSETWQELKELLKSENNILVAHNAQFDMGMLKKEKITSQKYICTLKLARYFDKDGVIPQFNLQYLRYYSGLNVEATAHDALGDIMVLEALFQKIHAKAVEEFGDEATDKMVEISKNPVLIQVMPFGKHKGQKMDKVPRDYLEWLLTTDLDEDLEYTVGHYLGF
jgi:exodeoxyribonuclease X